MTTSSIKEVYVFRLHPPVKEWRSERTVSDGEGLSGGRRGGPYKTGNPAQ